jgi:hypothetical protein
VSISSLLQKGRIFSPWTGKRGKGECRVTIKVKGLLRQRTIKYIDDKFITFKGMEGGNSIQIRRR